jgi:hypothetical protein
MNERQLRSRKIVTEIETRLQLIESDQTNYSMDAKITRVMPSDDDRSRQNDHTNQKLLHKIMEMMTKGFKDMQSCIKSENAKLVEKINSKLESGISRMALLIESNYIKLSEELNGNLRKEGEKWKGEMNKKVEGEVTLLRDEMIQIRADTATEILGMSNCLDNTGENLESKINSHVGEIDKQLGGVNEEVCAKTKVLEVEFKRQTEVQNKATKDVEQNVNKIEGEGNERWKAKKAAQQATSVKLKREIDELKRKMPKGKNKRKRGNFKWKPMVNERVLIRTHHKPDAMAGVTGKFIRSVEGPYVGSKLLSPLTVEICDSGGRNKGVFNWKSIKPYQVAAELGNTGVEVELRQKGNDMS